MTIPGVLYSLLLAIGAWAVEYFTTGSGGGIPWAPILVAAVPTVLKFFTVAQAPVAEPVEATSRGMDSVTAAPRSKLQKLLLG